MSSIKLENVSFSYGAGSQTPNQEAPLVLEDINLDINEGEFVCVLGSSGCGKSTLIRLLEGLNFPTRGRVLIDDNEVKGPGRDRCVVFQHYSLFSWFTAKDNVAFGVKQNKKDLSVKELDEIAALYLAKVGLRNSIHKYPHQMSGGQQQRVAIARALAMDPDILLMDEPFGAIDTKNRVLLQDMLRRICENERKKRTVVFITHDVDEAIFLSNRIVFMQPKRIREEIAVDFDKRRARSEIYGSNEFLRLRNRLIGFFYEDIAEALDITGAQL
ncbi:MAG: ABC transporter ATP-binding protein [Spirochaetaceae bacterium]|jgi:NitT/TauT family transport system ATP-binding protein|nr:ABC transporter ATP-binding protein [Spirochaetaceae bacterium]